MAAPAVLTPAAQETPIMLTGLRIRTLMTEAEGYDLRGVHRVAMGADAALEAMLKLQGQAFALIDDAMKHPAATLVDAAVLLDLAYNEATGTEAACDHDKRARARLRGIQDALLSTARVVAHAAGVSSKQLPFGNFAEMFERRFPDAPALLPAAGGTSDDLTGKEPPIKLADPDAELIALCGECCAEMNESDRLFRALVLDDPSGDDGCEHDQKARALFDRIKPMEPTTAEGRAAMARVALWYVGREEDESTIQTNYIGEDLAWKLVRQLAGGDEPAVLGPVRKAAREAAERGEG